MAVNGAVGRVWRCWVRVAVGVRLVMVGGQRWRRGRTVCPMGDGSGRVRGAVAGPLGAESLFFS